MVHACSFDLEAETCLQFCIMITLNIVHIAIKQSVNCQQGCMKGQILQACRGQCSREWLKGIDYVNSTCMERIVAPAHAHLFEHVG